MRTLLCNRVPVQKQELLSAIPMRALLCNRVPVRKQIRMHATNVPMVRNNTFPLRALESYLDPSLQTYVCPFSMRRMRNLFSVNLQSERK